MKIYRMACFSIASNNRFRATPANARDASGNEVYPGCNGTVCLPIAQQCAIRKQKCKTDKSFLNDY